MLAPWILRPIRPQDDQDVAKTIHGVMNEFGCSGDGFAIHDTEVDAMNSNYQDSGSGYYVVTRDGQIYGGAGFARLEGTTPDEAVCELRKMYYRPESRGLGLGRAMIELVLDEMRIAGYRRCYLETTSWMDRAQSLYRHAGFTEQSNREGQTGHHGCDTFFSRAL
jgi:putative acetyltransferase